MSWDRATQQDIELAQSGGYARHFATGHFGALQNRGPVWVDTVEKVSAKQLWNWNLKRWNPGK
jgi:hypothetical protein